MRSEKSDLMRLHADLDGYVLRAAHNS